MSPAAPIERFAAALSELEAELDWRALEPLYASGDARGFFSAEQIEAQRDAALHFASDFGEELEAGGRSLYVGVGAAELPLILFESLVLGREVFAMTLPGPEARELGRALDAVSARLDLALPALGTKPLHADGPEGCDHLWLVSVLSDPQAFPALHRKLYGLNAPRAKPLAEDTARAEELAAEALRRTATPALVHTSDEEFELVAEQARRRGRLLVATEDARTSPIVGDPVRTCRLIPDPASKQKRNR